MQQEEILTLQFGAFSNSILNDYWDLEVPLFSNSPLLLPLSTAIECRRSNESEPRSHT